VVNIFPLSTGTAPVAHIFWGFQSGETPSTMPAKEMLQVTVAPDVAWHWKPQLKRKKQVD
jgi:hypothetical protein